MPKEPDEVVFHFLENASATDLETMCEIVRGMEEEVENEYNWSEQEIRSMCIKLAFQTHTKTNGTILKWLLMTEHDPFDNTITVSIAEAVRELLAARIIGNHIFSDQDLDSDSGEWTLDHED